MQKMKIAFWWCDTCKKYEKRIPVIDTSGEPIYYLCRRCMNRISDFNYILKESDK